MASPTSPSKKSPKGQPKDGKKKKEKLHGVMEAASALTSLGDEDESGNESNTETTKQNNEKQASPIKKEKVSVDGKRYIPEHKKPDAAITFPEKLMAMMQFADKQPKGFCVEWIPDGKSFVIRDQDKFTRQVIPKFFKATKFTSFTRKLYRWGFRQVNRGVGPDDPLIFGNENFQRDNAELMANMRSTTPKSNKKNDGAAMGPGSMGVFIPGYETDQSRMLLDRIYQDKSMQQQGQFPMVPAMQYPMRPGMIPMYVPYPMPPGGSPGMGFMSPQQMSEIQQQDQPGTPASTVKKEVKSEEKDMSKASKSSPAEIVDAAIGALRRAA